VESRRWNNQLRAFAAPLLCQIAGDLSWVQ